MSKPESPIDKDSLKTSRPAIEELGGTLFMLAVVSDEDDAATLRADLKRSRLDEYKLQRCATTNDARNMLRACAFDLLVYTRKTASVPGAWEDSDPKYIADSQEVKLRSFTTSVHSVEAAVAYKDHDA